MANSINSHNENYSRWKLEQKTETKEMIDHPEHYGGKDNKFEVINIIEAYNLNFSLGNAIKYILRAGKKSDNPIEDLKKAAWYIKRQIEFLEKK
jgi:hypothetical protein